MHDVLRAYVGQDIGLNWEKPDRYEPMRLLEVAGDRFTVSAGPDEPVFHYAIPFVLSIAEGRFRVGKGSAKVTVPLLIQLSAWRPG